MFWNIFCYLLNSIVITEHTLYDFESFKSVKVCLITQVMVILMKVLCVLRKNVYPAAIRWHVWKTIISSRLMVLSGSTNLAIFGIFILPIAERGLLKSPTVIVKLPTSLSNSICILGLCVRGKTFRIGRSSLWIDCLIVIYCIMSLSVSVKFFFL